MKDIKYFCDVCNKECQELNIRTAKLTLGTVMWYFDVCRECFSNDFHKVASRIGFRKIWKCIVQAKTNPTAEGE